MNLKTISLAVTGFGVALVLFACVMWMANKPDFYSGERSFCLSVEKPGTTRQQECLDEMKKRGDAASTLYTNCLFSSQYAMCQSVTAVPFLSIAGIMIALAGGCLLLFGRTRRAA